MIKITKTELQEMYKSLTNKEICEKLQISNGALIALIKRAGLATKGKGNKRSKGRKIKITIIQEDK